MRWFSKGIDCRFLPTVAENPDLEVKEERLHAS